MYGLTMLLSILCGVGAVAAFSDERFVVGGLAAFGAVFFFFVDMGDEYD